MQDLLHEATDPWGVTVERVEVVIVMSHIVTSTMLMMT